MIIAEHEETALAFIYEVFVIYRLVISKFPDFCLNSKTPRQIPKFPDNSLTLKKIFFPDFFPDCGHPVQFVRECFLFVPSFVRISQRVSE